MEVCSEGSTPIAADLLTRAKAPGNSFAFLMTGVSTDYTEIMVLKDTTRSLKVALFLIFFGMNFHHYPPLSILLIKFNSYYTSLFISFSFVSTYLTFLSASFFDRSVSLPAET